MPVTVSLSLSASGASTERAAAGAGMAPCSSRAAAWVATVSAIWRTSVAQFADLDGERVTAPRAPVAAFATRPSTALSRREISATWRARSAVPRERSAIWSPRSQRSRRRLLML